MEMPMRFIRKLPIPKVLKEEYPIDSNIEKIKEKRDKEIRDIFTGEDKRLLMIIGPCSADREDAVMEYMNKLAALSDQVKDKIFIIPRVYTNKPRTKGIGYKGMLHQPNPSQGEDLLAGIIAIRQLHTRVIKETGMTAAEEMLYPANFRYLSDVLGYIAVGARSVENQEHRLVASGIGIPAGMKNPTSGDVKVMVNSVIAAQSPQKFIYRGWEVETDGNEFAHCVLRGYVDKFGRSHPNYHYENLEEILECYKEHPELKNPTVIIDCNHNNSGKRYEEQVRIAEEIIQSRNRNPSLKNLVKGLMIESYLLDGCQDISEGVYGKSITDPCLGWEKTERMIKDLADTL